MAKYSSLYKKLNKQQKHAVDTTDGPVMIIAGPGTGKTLTLTMRIAHILKQTDTDPGSILALTFTDSGSKEMRKRLLEIIGPTAYYVNIYTFHSFCSDIIKEFPDIFQISEDSSALSELERIQIFRELIDVADLEELKSTNAPYFYLEEMVAKIKDLKREHISPEELLKLIKKEQGKVQKTSEKEKINPRTGKPYAKFAQLKKKFTKNKELAKIYKAYQDKLLQMNRYDFEDMINMVARQLKSDKNFKLTLQEKYLYILVDEYQDTNSAQNEIIRLLTDTWENPNIFVVGDDEQSIFRFQGASIENVLYFQKVFKKAKVITLVSNYRSSQTILDASRDLIKKNVLKLDVDKSLKSKVRRANAQIQLGQFQDASIENKFIASQIKKLINSKIDPDEIAILVRHNRDIDDIKDALSCENIRFEIATGKNILEDGNIKRLLALFSVICNLNQAPSDDIEFFTLLNYEFMEFDKLDILKLSRLASIERVNLLEAILTENIFHKTDIKNPEKFIDLVIRLNIWQALDANTTFVKFFETVLQKSGFLDWILQDKYNLSRINTINTLFDEVKKLNWADHTLDLEKFLENINLMIENNIKIEEQPVGADTQAVKLLTAHKAKGMEFSYVFIAKCIDKKWGNAYHRELIKLPEGIVKNVNLDKKEKNEDERRLFYVALTRAKKQVFITFANEYSAGNFKRQVVPSMFLSEIDEKYLEKIDSEKFEKRFFKNIGNQLRLTPSQDLQLEKEDFLNTQLASFKLSVTNLNTYIQCPYKFKLNNILRTPRAKAIHLCFGTAVHAALEKFFGNFRDSKKLPKEEHLIKVFDEALKKEILTDKDLKSLQKRGGKVLSEYYDQNKSNFVQPLFTEYSFSYRKVYLGDIPLSGKIDKVEWVDKDKRTVKVVDYKTGTPKSRGEIEGKTKYSDGSLHRQLLFYKLLSQLDRNFNYQAEKGEFVFLESKSGKSAKNEIYDYKQEDIEDLKNTVRKNMEKIRKHHFERTKEYQYCQYCDFKQHCWPDGIPKN